jgi:glycosyltransferase involved in cell wall biosynthesis
MRAVASLGRLDLRVVSPVAYFPPLKIHPRWYPNSQISRRDVVDGLPVDRPRYLMLPKTNGRFTTALMYRGIRRSVRHLRQEFPFDVVDAHFVFPDGVVGAHLAREHGVPLVITARGVDLREFPKYPVPRRQITWALQQATQLIAVSEELAQKMVDLGADRSKITVISNGVNTEAFRPGDQRAARQSLGLPLDRRIILGVGYLIELKGFHLAIEALARIHSRHPDAFYAIAGGQGRFNVDYSRQIQETIARTGMTEHVRLLGQKRHDEIPQCYNAADLFAVLSSHEGSPNAPMEALACGLPVISAPIGSMPELMQNPGLGLLLKDREIDTIAAGFEHALTTPWDRTAIRAWAETQSWTQVANRVADVLESTLPAR